MKTNKMNNKKNRDQIQVGQVWKNKRSGNLFLIRRFHQRFNSIQLQIVSKSDNKYKWVTIETLIEKYLLNTN